MKEKEDNMITSPYEKRMVKDLSQKKEKGRNLSQNNTE